MEISPSCSQIRQCPMPLLKQIRNSRTVTVEPNRLVWAAVDKDSFRSLRTQTHSSSPLRFKTDLLFPPPRRRFATISAIDCSARTRPNPTSYLLFLTPDFRGPVLLVVNFFQSGLKAAVAACGMRRRPVMGGSCISVPTLGGWDCGR